MFIRKRKSIKRNKLSFSVYCVLRLVLLMIKLIVKITKQMAEKYRTKNQTDVIKKVNTIRYRKIIATTYLPSIVIV